jgi:hypothetical protein
MSVLTPLSEQVMRCLTKSSRSTQLTTWIAAIRIDTVTFALLGDPLPQWKNATLLAVDLTATSCSILNQAEGMFINMTFLSPITPTDLVRQTLPFTYLTVNVTSSDGAPHDVQVYTEITPGS